MEGPRGHWEKRSAKEVELLDPERAAWEEEDEEEVVLPAMVGLVEEEREAAPVEEEEELAAFEEEPFRSRRGGVKTVAELS